MADGKVSTNGWTRIALVRSDSDASKWYILGTRLLKTGKVEIGCDCPSRIYRKGTKAHGAFDCTCKHIRSVLDGVVPLANLDLTPEGVRFIDVYRSTGDAVQANTQARAAGIAGVSAGLTGTGGRNPESLLHKAQ